MSGNVKMYYHGWQNGFECVVSELVSMNYCLYKTMCLVEIPICFPSSPGRNLSSLAGDYKPGDIIL